MQTWSDEQDCRGLIFKSDQKPSVLNLKNKVVDEVGSSHDVIMEGSPVHQHQSHGVVERAVRTVGGVIPTHKLALEQSCSKELEGNFVVILWLIIHAAAMVPLFEIGSDGRTTCARSHGMPYRIELQFLVSVCSIFRWTEHGAQRTSWVRSSSVECVTG